MTATPTTRHPSIVREAIAAVDNTLMGMRPPMLIPTEPIQQDITRAHAGVLTSQSPQDKEAAQELLQMARLRLEEANQTNASHQQRQNDFKVLTDRRAQLVKELQIAERIERAALRDDAEKAYKQALTEFDAIGKTLCRSFVHLLELSRNCQAYGHSPGLPRFTLAWMKPPQVWDDWPTSQLIAEGSLDWLNDERQAAGKPIASSPVTVGPLPLPANM